MRIILIILLMLVSLIASGTNYYVSTSGSDSNDGLTPETPFKTLVKGRTLAVNPGDSLLLKRGDVWKSEVLTIQASGTAIAPIVIGAYGTGVKPIISERDTIVNYSVEGSWTETYTNIWSIANIGTIRRLWLDSLEYKESISAVSINAVSRWYSDFNSKILYVYSEDNPAISYTTIEIPFITAKNTYQCISGSDKDYIHIYNLDLRGGLYSINVENGNGWLIDSCNIGLDVNTFGIIANERSGTAVTDSCNNWVIKNCIFDSGLRLAVDFYEDLKEAEDCITIGFNCNNWEIHHNYFKDWRHTGISHYIQQDNGTKSDSIKIYNNYFTNPDVQSGRGISIGIANGRGSGWEIYNNISYDCAEPEQITVVGVKYHHNIINKVRGHIGRPTIKYGGLVVSQHIVGQSMNSLFYNNIIANCYSYGIELLNYNTNQFTGNKFINNILFNNDTISGSQIYIADNAYITANEFKNNLIYKQFHTDSLIFFGGSDGDDYKTVEEFNSSNGNKDYVIADNIGGDPLFVDALNDTLTIGAGSPAINAGIDVGLTTDFLGHLISSPPDIGAIQYQAPVPIPSGTVLLKSIRGKMLISKSGKFLK